MNIRIFMDGAICMELIWAVLGMELNTCVVNIKN